MMNDETIRLILELTGSASIQEATDKLATLKTRVTETSQGYDVLKRSTEGFAAAEDDAVRAAHEATQAQRAGRAALEETSTQVTDTTKAFSHMTGNRGQGILQASYAVQDFTSVLANEGGLSRALGSVQNNIPIMLSSLGMGAGLAGTISLVTVGLGAAIPLLMSFAGEQEKAAKATKKHADEAARLKGLLTSKQESTKQAVEGFLKDLPAGAAADAIQAAMIQEARHSPVTPEDIDRVMAETPGMGAEQAELVVRGDRVTAARASAERMFEGLLTDPSARAEAARLARSHGGFAPGFAGAMDAANRGDLRTPAEQKAGRQRLEQRQKEEDAAIIAAADAEDKDKTHRQADLNRGVGETIGRINKETHEAAAEKRRNNIEAARIQQQQNREQEQAEQAAATKARHDREKYAREHTPMAINRRQQAAIDNEAMGYVQQAMPGAFPERQAEVAKHMAENFNAGEAWGHSVREQIEYAIQQTRDDIARGMNAGLKRSNQMTETRR